MSRPRTMPLAALLTCLALFVGPENGVLSDWSTSAFGQVSEPGPFSSEPVPVEPFSTDDPFAVPDDDGDHANEPKTIKIATPVKKPARPSVDQKASFERVVPDDSSPPIMERIEKGLDGLVSFELTEVPLSDVIKILNDSYDFNVVLDQRALDDFVIPSDSPVTCHVRGIPLGSALDLLLRNLDLTWTIHHDVLLITSSIEVETLLIPVVYEVSDLVICRNKRGELWADFDSLTDNITNNIENTDWDIYGGIGSISENSLRGAEVLVITHTYHVHRKIETFLRQLRDMAADKGTDAEPPLRKNWQQRSRIYGCVLPPDYQDGD